MSAGGGRPALSTLPVPTAASDHMGLAAMSPSAPGPAGAGSCEYLQMPHHVLPGTAAAVPSIPEAASGTPGGMHRPGQPSGPGPSCRPHLLSAPLRQRGSLQLSVRVFVCEDMPTAAMVPPAWPPAEEAPSAAQAAHFGTPLLYQAWLAHGLLGLHDSATVGGLGPAACSTATWRSRPPPPPLPALPRGGFSKAPCFSIQIISNRVACRAAIHAKKAKQEIGTHNRARRRQASGRSRAGALALQSDRCLGEQESRANQLSRLRCTQLLANALSRDRPGGVALVAAAARLSALNGSVAGVPCAPSLLHWCAAGGRGGGRRKRGRRER